MVKNDSLIFKENSVISWKPLDSLYRFGSPKSQLELYPKVTFLSKNNNNNLMYFVWNLWKLDILNTYLSVKYSMTKEKHGDIMKKNMQQVPKPR